MLTLLTPSALNLLVRMPIAWFMAAGVGNFPLPDTALSVIDVPPCRSRPSRTLNLSCQLPGCTISPPMMVANNAISSTSSAARYRHGLDTVPVPACLDMPPGRDPLPRGLAGLLLGGATCACPYDVDRPVVTPAIPRRG